MKSPTRSAGKQKPDGYASFLADLKTRVQASQSLAARSVNRELICLYWHIGGQVARAQKNEGWGSKVVERLARDLSAAFPEMSGFSAVNLNRMLGFYTAWAPAETGDGRALRGAAPILSQPVTKLRKAGSRSAAAPILSRLVTKLDGPPEPLASLSWSANLLLLHKLKDPARRLWYACKAIEHGWSRTVLAVQIESHLHERSGKAVTNFDLALPPALSDMAREVLKDPYTFDFLSLGEEAHERDLERGLVAHVQQLLLEMGAGFAFVGRQVHLEIGDEDFYLDLLFYHLRLRCFVVVDLKMKPFEPEFAGKMNFYLSAVDDRMKHKDDSPTIGLLLCKDARNKVKIEYALRDVKKPIGVAEWQTRLVDALPRQLRGSLPTIAELERELKKPAKNDGK
jgi:predicted nuclease of restriction endonuclease-like (RecB) superfamily